MALKMSALPGYIYPTCVLTDEHVHVMSLGSILIFQRKAYIVVKAKNRNNVCKNCAMVYEITKDKNYSGCKLTDGGYPCKTNFDSNYQLLNKNNISKDFGEGL